MMLKCVLLDACIIIESYKYGIWDKLIERVEISVASSVVQKEALFHMGGRVPEPIQLRRLIDAGKIKEFSATAQEIFDFINVFDDLFARGLDEGEIESLSIIKSGKITDTPFSTGDAAAIKALAMIGESHLGISMETLLMKAGLQQKLQKQYTEKFFKDIIEEGKRKFYIGMSGSLIAGWCITFHI